MMEVRLGDPGGWGPGEAHLDGGSVASWETGVRTLGPHSREGPDPRKDAVGPEGAPPPVPPPYAALASNTSSSRRR
jgi:hypothetical protein